jgi:hypothetical protein
VRVEALRALPAPEVPVLEVLVLEVLGVPVPRQHRR